MERIWKEVVVVRQSLYISLLVVWTVYLRRAQIYAIKICFYNPDVTFAQLQYNKKKNKLHLTQNHSLLKMDTLSLTSLL